jgi:hypothetical protein
MLDQMVPRSSYNHHYRISRWIETTKSVLELSVPQSSPAVSTVGADLIAKPLSTSLDHGPLQGVLGIISDGRCKVGRDPVLVKQPGRILDEPLLRCAERKYGLYQTILVSERSVGIIPDIGRSRAGQVTVPDVVH